jgi:hypothetical protein
MFMLARLKRVHVRFLVSRDGFSPKGDITKRPKAKGVRRKKFSAVSWIYLEPYASWLAIAFRRRRLCLAPQPREWPSPAKASLAVFMPQHFDIYA